MPTDAQNCCSVLCGVCRRLKTYRFFIVFFRGQGVATPASRKRKFTKGTYVSKTCNIANIYLSYIRLRVLLSFKIIFFLTIFFFFFVWINSLSDQFSIKIVNNSKLKTWCISHRRHLSWRHGTRHNNRVSIISRRIPSLHDCLFIFSPIYPAEKAHHNKCPPHLFYVILPYWSWSPKACPSNGRHTIWSRRERA